MASEADNKAVDASKIDHDANEKFSMGELASASRHDEKEGWVFHSEIGDKISVYTRANPDNTPNMVCGVGIIEASPKRILEEVSDPVNWKEWDSMLNTVDIDNIDDRHRVVRLTIYGMFPVSARDVVYHETRVEEEDGTIALATMGINYDKYPITNDYVRANLKAGGWHMKPMPDDPNRTMVTYFMNTDPLLAYIPNFIMNMAVSRFPMIIEKVRSRIKQKDEAAAKNKA